MVWRVFQLVIVVKNPLANAGDMRCRFNPWVGKIPWRRAQKHTLVFLLREPHGQRNLVGTVHGVPKSQT